MTSIQSAQVTKDGKVVPVTVEVEMTSGIGIHLIGLADQAVKESLLRTITALQSSGYHFPGKKVVINLAPADLHKNGSGYDLPIALGILLESGQVSFNPDQFHFYGELGLDGSIRDAEGYGDVMDHVAGQGGGVVGHEAFATLAELIEFAQERWR